MMIGQEQWNGRLGVLVDRCDQPFSRAGTVALPNGEAAKLPSPRDVDQQPAIPGRVSGSDRSIVHGYCIAEYGQRYLIDLSRSVSRFPGFRLSTCSRLTSVSRRVSAKDSAPLLWELLECASLL